jgi:hypothetical protein
VFLFFDHLFVVCDARRSEFRRHRLLFDRFFLFPTLLFPRAWLPRVTGGGRPGRPLLLLGKRLLWAMGLSSLHLKWNEGGWGLVQVWLWSPGVVAWARWHVW